MLDKLQLSFEENDADKEVLQSVLSLTKKSGKCESNQRKKKLSEIFSNNDLMQDILIEEKKQSLKAFVFLHTQVQMYNL